ncbi:MAG TPA: hypothetical protein VJH96_00850 [Patescibacteria group bacterium]|nr:hypothetical protein [Patescibacteria group bacterium]
MKIEQKKIQEIFGTINPPPGSPTGNPVDDLVRVLNVGLNLTIVIAGLYTLIQFIWTGLDYLRAEGDAKKLKAAHDKIKWTLVGLLVVVVAPLLAAIVGLVVFGDPLAILRPEIKTVP